MKNPQVLHSHYFGKNKNSQVLHSHSFYVITKQREPTIHICIQRINVFMALVGLSPRLEPYCFGLFEGEEHILVYSQERKVAKAQETENIHKLFCLVSIAQND